MSTVSNMARTIAAPGAFVGAVIVLYAVAPFGSADSETEMDTSRPVLAQSDSDAVPPEVPQLTAEHRDVLEAHRWSDWVGRGTGIWVSVNDQTLRVVRDYEIVWQAPCATAARGTGSEMNSYKTPLGWHSVKKKVGDGARPGQVFRSAQPTKEIWKPGQVTEEDLVLTRILWLTGEEPGKNLGGSVDSYSRYIYIHGTNEEDKIGTPSSHGCVRLRNHDVIELYDLVGEGTPVLITERR